MSFNMNFSETSLANVIKPNGFVAL